MNAAVDREFKDFDSQGKGLYPQAAEPTYTGTTGQISAAMAKAQAEMQNPGFDSTNPHFKNKFASLAAVRNAVVPVFAKYGISVSQDISSVDGGIACVTILSHGSGQQMRFGPLILPVSKNDAQGFGSAATYCRRYALMAVACVVGDDDDDAQAAVKATPVKPVVDQQLVADAAQQMRNILLHDVAEDVMALQVADYHDALNKDQDLYQAAAGELPANLRSAWKRLLSDARKRANAEPKPNGRA